MTKVASKGGLRAAHEARTSRHAQRTPLPPRPGQVEAAREPVTPKERYGKMTQPELLARAQELGLQPPKSAPKGKLLEAILAKEKAVCAAIIDDLQQEMAGRKNAKLDAALPKDSRSAAKAVPVREAMTAHGWSTILVPADDTTPAEDIWELTGKRGDEVLWISWTAGKLTLQPMPTYTIQDRTIKLKNASAVKQYAARPTEVSTAELKKVEGNKFWRKAPVEPKRAPLPFNPKTATDEEVISHLLGKVVAWHNRYRQVPETAQVGRNAAKVELVECERGDRIFKFCCPATGFKAFRLSALTRVGNRKFRTRGQTNSGVYAPVELEDVDDLTP